MSDFIIQFFAVLIFAVLGFVLGTYFSKLKSKGEQSSLEERLNQAHLTNEDLKQGLSKVEQNREEIRREKELLTSELAIRNTEFENLQQLSLKRDEEIELRQEQLRKDFELLATKILDEKSEKFTLQNKENIKNILTPLQDKIKTFEEKVDLTQKESISMHSALKEQLLGLKDLNQQMTKEATNLTRALKGDSKMQGNWGELVLERVLEKSGLEKDREYFVQQSFTLPDGSRVLPDVVLHLPDQKKMIIDSKVSLTDYERFVNAEDEDKSLFLKAHVNSIRKHVDQLSEKNYQDLYDIESPDFVLMFIPIEPAFAVVVNEDNSIYNRAFEKNIVIVTPSTLLATLRTIDSMWNNEKQQQNAIEIARQAGNLYDKFCGFLDNMNDIGKALQKATEAHEKGYGQLSKGSGNLVGRVEKLRDLGIQSKKELPVSFAQFDKVHTDGAIEQQDELTLEEDQELDRTA